MHTTLMKSALRIVHNSHFLDTELLLGVKITACPEHTCIFAAYGIAMILHVFD